MNICNFSEDRKYRYTLTKKFVSVPRSICVFIGLNPSTADENQDDPTIRRCIGYASHWGYEALTMLNIFAYRSTDPKVLYQKSFDPIGSDNDQHIVVAAQGANLVICAWGAHGELNGRGFQVKSLLQSLSINLHFLRQNTDGQPTHPLYLPRTLEPVEWL